MNSALDPIILKKVIEHFVMENEVMHACYSLDGQCCYYESYTIEDLHKKIHKKLF